MNHLFLMCMCVYVLTNVERAFTGTHIYACIYNIHPVSRYLRERGNDNKQSAGIFRQQNNTMEIYTIIKLKWCSIPG